LGKKILIIKDDEQTRCLMEEALVRMGYEVTANAQLASLIVEAKSGEFDLITLDLGLPEIRGTDVADLLTHHTATPILVVSGMLDGPARCRLERAGITAYVEKPFRMADLLAQVSQMLT
tara:strand:- start:1696 stop:2052 length:357 start_codon:yes stop_codon:yes gene_type:complete